MKAGASGTHKELNTADAAVCRAAVYSALALGFRPPSPETVARLLSPEGTAILARSAALVDSRNTLASHILKMAGVASLPALIASYQGLFGHTARGAVSPYETEYGHASLFQQPQEMADLAGFYRAFGNKTNHR